VGMMVFAVSCLLAGGCGGGGHKTPEDAFKAARTSLEKEDWKGFSDCLTDDSRDQMAGGFVMIGVMMKLVGSPGGDEAKAKLKPIDDVLAKHGLTDEVMKKMPDEKPGKDPESAKKAMKKLVEPIKDKGAFIADMMAAMKKMGDGKKENSIPLPKDAELKDVKIEGDTAKGFVVTKEKKEPIEFRKVGGGWKIEMPMDPLKG
jgi:hypothetical protein